MNSGFVMGVLINRYLRHSKIRTIRRERFRFGVRKVLIGVVGSFVLSLMFIFCHDMIIQLAYFKANHVEVKGNSRLSREDVLTIAQISQTPNILAVNRLIARKRLQDHPWIVNADVIRELPNRLAIQIQEYIPIAVLEIGTRYLMDSDGHVFKEATESEGDGLPLVAGLDLTDLNTNTMSESTVFSSVLAVLKIGKATHAIIPNQNIYRIIVDRDVGVTLVVREPVQALKIQTISLGLSDFEKKYRSLDMMIGYLKKTHMTDAVERIDMTDIRRIVVRPAAPKAASTDNLKEDV